MLLKESSKIKPRAKIIFGTGDSLKAITLTSNIGFVRAAAQQVCIKLDSMLMKNEKIIL